MINYYINDLSSLVIHFIKNNNIDKYTNTYTKLNSQIGGETYSTIIDNLELKFDYFINKTDDNTIIYITEPNDQTGLKYCSREEPLVFFKNRARPGSVLTLSEPSPMFAMLSYSNKDILNVGIIETPRDYFIINNLGRTLITK
jgi:hypothetical protein